MEMWRKGRQEECDVVGEPEKNGIHLNMWAMRSWGSDQQSCGLSVSHCSGSGQGWRRRLKGQPEDGPWTLHVKRAILQSLKSPR